MALALNIFYFKRVATLLMLLLSLLNFAYADEWEDWGELKVKRKEVYEFTEKPSLKQDGDKVLISFISKDFCDATIAIEDENGKIVRHLVSGVLGSNAPMPFKKDSLQQEVLWDCKDDRGEYVKNKNSIKIRVSLGLKPQYEKSLYSEPKKKSILMAPLFQATPEGVYVYEAGDVSQLRLFDHEGEYVRTVYPFPANKISSFEELKWHTFIDNKKYPQKLGGLQATLLNTSPFAAFDGVQGTGTTLPGGRPNHFFGFAVSSDKIAVAQIRVNRFTTSGGFAGAPLYGPTISYEAISGAQTWNGGGKAVPIIPTSMALSPDAKWIYMANYVWMEWHGTGGFQFNRIHSITRMPYEGAKSPELFVGSLKPKETGNSDDKFHGPTSVVCDSLGNVWVADHFNDRIQVFSPEAKLLKSIKIKRPVQVSLNQKNGEIYVLSWYIKDMSNAKIKEEIFNPTMTHLKSLEKSEVISVYKLPFSSVENGLEYQAMVDCNGKKPTLWIGQGKSNETGIRLYSFEKNELKLIRDFGGETVKSIKRNVPASYLRQRIYVNPTNDIIYVAEGDAGVGKSTGRLLEINTSTKKVNMIELPFDAEDFALDYDGFIYLKAMYEIARYDPKSWKEVPFDYGEEKAKAGFASSLNEGKGKRNADLISSLRLTVNRYNHHGGMMVNASGKIIVSIHGGQENDIDRKLTEEEKNNFKVNAYRGRGNSGLVWIFDKHGKLIADDALPGISFTHGVGLDKDDNIYVMAMANRLIKGKRYFNYSTDTVIKFSAMKGKVYSESTNPAFVALPFSSENKPKRSPDIDFHGGGRIGKCWVDGAEWFFGGVGFNGRNEKTVEPPMGCDCHNSRFALDYFARSFATELGRYSVAIVDSSGNLITRVGKYGNADSQGPNSLVPLGDDEVGLMHSNYVATLSDKFLFIADIGNQQIVMVKLNYHLSEFLTLK